MKKITIPLLIVALSLICFLILKKETKEDDIEKTINTILPKNLNSQIIFQEDKTNKGQKYISNMYFIKDDTNAKQFVQDFIFKTINLLNKKNKFGEISAISIVVYKDHTDKSQSKQYRILIGSNIVKTKDLNFWSSKNYEEVFKFLQKTCPDTSSGNLRDFCFISENME